MLSEGRRGAGPAGSGLEGGAPGAPAPEGCEAGGSSGAPGPLGGDEAFEALAALPSLDEWPGLPEQEREHRRAVLYDVALRVLADGPRRARPSPERGRQFLAFAALQGYGEMVEEALEEDEEGGQAPGPGA